MVGAIYKLPACFHSHAAFSRRVKNQAGLDLGYILMLFPYLRDGTIP